MKKRTFTFLMILMVSAPVILSQQYFFYHFKEKKVLTVLGNFITVKLDDNSQQSSKIEISRALHEYIKKEMIFTAARENNNRNEVIICELKDNVSRNTADGLVKKLAGMNSVISVGEGFSSGDKIVHFTTNEIVVRFKSYVSIAEIKSFNKLFKTNIIEKVSGMDNVYLLAVESNGADGKDNVFDAANKFALSSLVEYSQPNFIRYGMIYADAFSHSPRSIPNDTMLNRMWHIKNTGNNIPEGVMGTPGCDMNVIPAWDIATGNPDVLISIVDTGIDTNHTDLKNQLSSRTLWYDAYDNDQKPFDEYYHGTGVSGTAIAEGNNIAGTVGVAYGCKVLPVRVFGPYPNAFTTDLILAKGLNWAWQKGAAVINCSWGGGVPTPTITQAIQHANWYGRNGKGTIVFGGAGNDDTDIVIYPASMEEVVGVGGLSPCNQRKSKVSCDNVSNNQNWGACFGNGMEIVAPCTYIGTTELFGGWCICGNGTSCSSPLAAAVAALMISRNNNISGDSVKAILFRSAVKVGNYNYNVPKQYGMWNYEMGYGRVDARFALDMTPPGPSAQGEQVPPVITIYPPESGVYNETISFNAKITDIEGVAGGNNLPRLYYRTLQYPARIFSTVSEPLGNDLYKFTFPLAPYSEGFYYYISAQDIAPVPNIMTYPFGGNGINPPGSQAPQKLMYVRNTNYYDTFFTSTDVPVIIPDNGYYLLYSVLNNVPNRIVLDIDIMVNVVHGFIADLTLSLISPSGREVPFVSGIGWDSDSLKYTILDDEADISIDSSAAVPPYPGTYKPVDKLWLFDGEPAGGQWKLKIVDNGLGDGGKLTFWRVRFRFAKDDNILLPGSFGLIKNYPNPFNPLTRVIFNVPYTSFIKINLYDITGRLVKELVNEMRPPRLEDYVDFDASALNDGKGLASGVYFYTMTADDEFIDAKKMVLIK